MKTSGHDPLAFGQIRFSTPPGEAVATGRSPDGQREPVERERDTSWDPPGRPEEIVVRVASDAPTGTPAAASKFGLPAATAAEPTRPHPAERWDRPRSASPAPRPLVAAPDPCATSAGATLAEAAVPAAVFTGCEAAAAWLWLAADNPVLGALAAVLGFGLAAFAWFALRR